SLYVNCPEVAVEPLGVQDELVVAATGEALQRRDVSPARALADEQRALAALDGQAHRIPLDLLRDLEDLDSIACDRPDLPVAAYGSSPVGRLELLPERRRQGLESTLRHVLVDEQGSVGQ